ncbi:flippase [Halorubrum ezzemoulense]|uniref:Flippase n=1 Tax=Halorubrum ezzemoulense TaxID=337243 RepID=A0ABT4Z761_HALEZ|nr:flippase [Halorubrum ezzemoulense]MDB2246503.1 flippase [Halorubrum ezzemoulense]MDB2290549.1 flippase [Halorubrum ezzemoulense]MDB2294023.1 flippase [Halorubrum ezzemoulense]MDB2298027.1 flippase [Halorubrum ezzemoulense]
MSTLLRSIFSILSGKAAGIIISLAFTPILVRIISQEQYGLYVSVLAGFSIFALLAKGGLFDSSRKIIAENIKNQTTASDIVSISVLISIAYGITAVSVASLGILFEIVPSRYVSFVWILLIAVIFGNVFSIVKGAFYGQQREHVAEILNIGRRVFYVVVGLALAYIGYDLIGLFTAYSISFVVIGVLGFILLSRYFRFSVPSTKSIRRHGREIAAFGGFQMIGGLSAAFLYKSDILLVEYFQTSTATALYNSAIVPAEMIWFVPSVIQMAFLQHTANLWAEDDIEEINVQIRTGIKYSILALTLFGVGLFALAEPFLQVYFGGDYVAAADTLRLLIIGTFFFGISRVIVPVFQATGWVKHTELMTVGALLVNVLLNIILIPQYGIIGAGIGTSISYVMLFVGNICIWFYSPFEMVSLRWTASLVLAQSVFTVVFLAIVSIIETSPLISLFVFPPSGLVLFISTNVVFGHIPIQELRYQIKSVTERI